MKLHFLRYFLNEGKDSCLHPKSTHFVARRNDDHNKIGKEKQKQRVMYIDADCEINDHCPTITSLEQSGKSLFVAPGFSGRINAGVLIAWDDPEAISLISLTIDNRKTALPDSDQV
jgi:hypothetical protein